MCRTTSALSRPGQIDESTKVSQALKNLSKLQRDTVINDETKETVYMAYPEGQVWTDAGIQWKPGGSAA